MAGNGNHVSTETTYIVTNNSSPIAEETWNIHIHDHAFHRCMKTFGPFGKRRQMTHKEISVRDMTYRQDTTHKVVVSRIRAISCQQEDALLVIVAEHHKLNYSSFPCTTDVHNDCFVDSTIIQVSPSLKIIFERKKYPDGSVYQHIKVTASSQNSTEAKKLAYSISECIGSKSENNK
jgi:hypothetical protein